MERAQRAHLQQLVVHVPRRATARQALRAVLLAKLALALEELLERRVRWVNWTG